MVKRFRFGVQTRLDIPQPFALSQLREHHANELLSNSEMPHPRFGMETVRQTGEGLPMNQIENLGENVATGIHPE